MPDQLSHDEYTTLYTSLTGVSPWTGSYWGNEWPDPAEIDWHYDNTRVLRFFLERENLSPRVRQILQAFCEVSQNRDEHNPGDLAKIDALQKRNAALQERVDRFDAEKAAYKAATSLQIHQQRDDLQRLRFQYAWAIAQQVIGLMRRGEIHCSPFMREFVLDAAGHRCMWIDAHGQRCEHTKPLEIDHCKPKELGYRLTYDNIAALCREHNKAKGALIGPEWEYWKRPEYAQFRQYCRTGFNDEVAFLTQKFEAKANKAYSRAYNPLHSEAGVAQPPRAFGPG